MPDRSLDSLSSDFYPLACQWIARVAARGVAVMVIQTSRTWEEHKANLAAGTSGTALSLHLPRIFRWEPTLAVLSPDDKLKSDAMDIAPYEVYASHGPDKIAWDTKNPAWGIIGEEAERVGLRWGGRWQKPFDPGHAEFLLPWRVKYVAEERARPWPTFRTT